MQRLTFWFVFLFYIIGGILAGENSYGSWQKVLTCRVGTATIPNNSGVARAAYCAFFFNEFVGLVGSSGDAGIYLTTDGGVSWERGKIPPGYSGNITQIFMTDRQRGWATIEEPGSNSKCLWKTIDGGHNWVTIGPVGYFDCVYETPSTLVVTSRQLLGAIGGIISPDGGTTFQNGLLDTTNGVDFVDAFHGVATGFQDARWQRTVDGGRNWSFITPFVKTECWGVYGQKGTATFYACPETDPRTRPKPGMSPVLRSDDYGATWQNVGALNFYSCGAIQGAAGVLYIQADQNKIANPKDSGIFRSTDRGVNWKYVGGPSSTQDTRFAVTGCSGGVVYAFDAAGGVWKTRDGGDGAIIEPPSELEISGTTIAISGKICDVTTATLGLINHYCEADTIVLVDLVDQSSVLFTSGALSVLAIPPLPRTLNEGGEDSIIFRWDPSKLFNSDTTFSTSLRLRYYSNILARFVDTTITLTIHAIGEPPQASILPTQLQFGAVDFCKPYDTLITIVNHGCDTMTILSAVALQQAGLTITDAAGNALTLPIELASGDSIRLRVGLLFMRSGGYTNSIDVTFRHQGITRDTMLTISASIDGRGTYALPDSIFFGSVSTCNPADSAIALLNLNCVDITIESATIAPSPNEFSVVSATTPIAANSNGSVLIRFTPAVSGTFDAILTIRFTVLGEQLVKQIPLHGIGTTDPAFLRSTQRLDTLFDLSLTRCDSPMVFPIDLSNPGCKKVTIQSVTTSPTISPDVSVNWTPPPVDLINGSSFGITTTVTPKEIGTFSGMITIRFQIEGEAAKDTTVLYFLNVDHGSRYLSLSDDTIDLGTIRYCQTSDATVVISNPGCDTLTVNTYTLGGSTDFTMTSSPKYIYATSEQDNISIHLLPTTTGKITGTLNITSNSDTAASRTIPIIARVIPTDTLILDIVATRSDMRVGDTITFQLIPRRSVHGNSIFNLSFDLNLNSDLLSIIDDKSLTKMLIPNVNYFLGATGGTAKHSTQTITLQGQPFIEVDSGIAMMNIVFVVRLTDSNFTSMFLSTISINGGDSNFAKCVLGILSSELNSTIIYECGDKTLEKYLQLGNDLSIKVLGIIPDPLTIENNFRAELPYAVSREGEVRLEVFDLNGKAVFMKSTMQPAAGIYSFEIDGQSFPSGIYNYRLRSIPLNTTVTGSFRVMR